MRPCEQPNYTAILIDLLAKDSNAGLGKIDWGNMEHLTQEKTQLIELFNSHFGLREVSAETMGRWIFILQKRYNEIKRDYDHRFHIIHQYADKMDDLGRTIEVIREYGQTDKVTFQDTPVTPLGEDDYATNITDDVKGGQDKETKTDNTEMYIKEMNTLIKEYNDVSMRFVEEFESCFMSTIMRV